ncbi:hypothetical protein BU16DRAFT_29311 [Lophium mytilinum]|uniref:Arginine repressor DNA-binding domain-containing protein n=1 Tax=Lophium mytilinum TaxID=390894 RepID=A0A6A6RFB7_9PEZI|nr:hypothetical protein BU16DRAFT_29311 [Lophium mytilinum]
MSLAREPFPSPNARTRGGTQTPVSESQRLEINLVRYGAAVKPRLAKSGRPLKLSQADEDRVFQWLLEEGWKDQDEIVKWLGEEHGVEVSQATVSRMLKRRNWTRETVKLQSSNRELGGFDAGGAQSTS